MSVRRKHLELVVGAAGAAALTIGGMASPALAATHNLTYNCSTGSPGPLGPVHTTLNPGAIPTNLVAGQSVSRAMSMVVHLDQTQTATAQALGKSVNGKVTAKGPLAFKLSIPDTPIPSTPGATMDVTGSGNGTITATKAGSFKLNAGAIAATLNLSGGAAPITATQKCAPPTNGTQTLGTISVAKDRTTTTASATYKASKHLAVGKAKVRSHFGLRATGKVKFTLKKGTHKIASIKGKLNKKGIAHAKFKNVRKHGKYSITAKYLGNAALKTSKDKATFTVG